MRDRDRSADVLEVEESRQHQLGHGAEVERMQSQDLRLSNKKGGRNRKGKKDGRAKPDRGIKDANEPDDQDHGLTLRKMRRACQDGNKPCARKQRPAEFSDRLRADRPASRRSERA